MKTKTTAQYLGELKKHWGIESDYALAKKLETSGSVLHSYRTGRTRFDNYMCMRVAEILHLDPMLVIADIQAEREKRPEVKKYWINLAQSLRHTAALLAVVMLSALLWASPQKSTACELERPQLYIMLNIVRRWLRALARRTRRAAMGNVNISQNVCEIVH